MGSPRELLEMYLPTTVFRYIPRGALPLSTAVDSPAELSFEKGSLSPAQTPAVTMVTIVTMI